MQEKTLAEKMDEAILDLLDIGEREKVSEDSSEDKKADSEQQNKANDNASEQNDSTTASMKDIADSDVPKRNNRRK